MLTFRTTTNRLQKPLRLPAPRIRNIVFFTLALITIVFGVKAMFHVLNANGVTVLEGAILVLFTVTFAWISLAFWTAAAGFVLQLLRLDPLSLQKNFNRGDPNTPISTRTAIVMPVYNEDTERVISGLEATYQDLMSTGEGDQYDFYLLSDTDNPRIAAAEERAISALCSHVNAARDRIFYRRRDDNTGRKAGNIADFCRKWGAYYDYMIVLDADSLMSGKALTTLTRAMQVNPSAGIIQTVPIPVRQETMFGRFMQFAASLYSPMLATGMAFWQQGTANYWGHNAIIRIDAFTNHCDLPTLPGQPPLGGEILSHDFVEAAFMKRGGYHVYLFPEMGGSYEETPGNLVDHAKRDRRWAEGNFQHLRLLAAQGLHPINRLHFTMGALAYACSFLWLIMLVFGTMDATSRAVGANEFFVSAYQLHPNWPITRTEEIISLLWIVAALLFVPKLMAVLLAMTHPGRRRSFGGGIKLLASSVIELLFSILIAPVMMTYHTYFVVTILLGGRVTWIPQNRDGQYVAIDEAFRSTAVMTLTGVAWTIVTVAITPMFALALTPVLAGLILSAPLVAASSSVRIGLWFRRCQLLQSPCESDPPKVLRRLWRSSLASRTPNNQPLLIPEPPPVNHRAMSPQTVDSVPRWKQSTAYNTSV